MTPHTCQSPFFLRSLVLHLSHSHGWQMSIMTNGNIIYKLYIFWDYRIFFSKHELDWLIQLTSSHNVLPILNISSHHGSHCHFDEGEFSHVKNTIIGVVYILKSFFHFTKGIDTRLWTWILFTKYESTYKPNLVPSRLLLPLTQYCIFISRKWVVHVPPKEKEKK